MTDGSQGRQPPSASGLAGRQSARGEDAEREGVPDAGPVRNTVLQFATQLVGLLFTGALTLYLVRALGPSGYGVYALAISIAGLLLLPAGLGLPTALGRFLADHRGDLGQVRAILGFGMRLQTPAAAVAGVALFAAAGAVADAFGEPALTWPLRWAAIAVAGQAVFSFLAAVGTSVRQARLGLWMALTESAIETFASASLVLAGAGAAGATLGRAIGYGVGAAVGLILALRLLRRPRGGGLVRLRLRRRTLMRYAGVMFVVDLSFSALAQLDVLLIGALLSAAAVGAFSAVWRILAVLGYLGIAVAGGVAPRLSLGGGASDTWLFGQGIRYLLIVQGLVIAPMLVWSKPIVDAAARPRVRQFDSGLTRVDGGRVRVGTGRVDLLRRDLLGRGTSENRRGARDARSRILFHLRSDPGSGAGRRRDRGRRHRRRVPVGTPLDLHSSDHCRSAAPSVVPSAYAGGSRRHDVAAPRPRRRPPHRRPVDHRAGRRRACLHGGPANHPRALARRAAVGCGAVALGALPRPT